jgi:transposase InsO family protein
VVRQPRRPDRAGHDRQAFPYAKGHAFKASLREIGTRHLTTRPPYRLRTNGRAERLIRTALREWLYGRPHASSAARATDMPAWLHWYNHRRPKTSIRSLTPAARLSNLLGNNI